MFIHGSYPLHSIIKVTDGDTLVVMIDMGFGVRYEKPIRLLGIDAPEKFGISADVGKLVKQCMIKMTNKLMEDKVEMTVRSDELDMYGRILGDIEFELNGKKTSLVKEMVALKLVKEYSTAHRPEWTKKMLKEAKQAAENYLELPLN